MTRASAVVVAYRAGEGARAPARLARRPGRPARGGGRRQRRRRRRDRGRARARRASACVEPGGERRLRRAAATSGAAAATGDVLALPEPGHGRRARRAWRSSRERSRIPRSGSRWRGCVLLDRPELLNSRGLRGCTSAASPGRAATASRPTASTELRDVAAASGDGHGHPAETFRELGGFTDELFMYQEDLAARLEGAARRPARRRRSRRRRLPRLRVRPQRRQALPARAEPARVPALDVLAAPAGAAAAPCCSRPSWPWPRTPRARAGCARSSRGWAWVAGNARWLARQRRATQRAAPGVRPRARAPAHADALAGHDRPARRRRRAANRARRGLLAAGPAGAVTELSVVLVNHDGAECLPAALRALAEQHGGRRTSSASSSTRRRRTAAGRTSSATGTGRGRFASRRTSASAAAATRARGPPSGRLVAFVNFDGEVEPGWDAPLRGLLEDPGRRRWRPGSCSTPPARRSRRPGSRSPPTWPPSAGTRGSRGRRRPRSRSTSTAASGALMMMRREEFLELGGFYEPIWMYGEEADLRAARAGPDRPAPGERDPPRPRRGRRPAAGRARGSTGARATGS